MTVGVEIQMYFVWLAIILVLLKNKTKKTIKQPGMVGSFVMMFFKAIDIFVRLFCYCSSSSVVLMRLILISIPCMWFLSLLLY